MKLHLKNLLPSYQFHEDETNLYLIKFIYYDSRLINQSQHSLFIDLAKKKEDSLEHILQCRQKNISFIITSYQHEELQDLENIIIVDNVLKTLQKGAITHRNQFNIPIIGITGSNGKTIVKEWLSTLLSDYNVIKNPGSYNSQLGVPLSILNLEESHQYGIFEAGISKVGEMQKLHEIIKPTIGILTNIGDAHDAGFLNRKEKLQEKIVLFEDAELLIIKETSNVKKEEIQDSTNARLISWTTDTSFYADYYVSIDSELPVIQIKISGKQELAFTFPLKDTISITNIVFAIICSLELNIPSHQILHNLQEIAPISMRAELLAGRNNCIIINDTYNADVTSFQGAIELSKNQQENKNLHIILAPFDELRDEYIDDLRNILNELKPSKLSLINFNKLNISELREVNYYEDIYKLLDDWKRNPPINEMLIFKGAPRFKLQKIIQQYTRIVHKTQMNVYLNHIRHNINEFQSLLAENVQLMCVIKAGAYGTDSVILGKMLTKLNVDYLAVAYVDEGIELREAGIQMPILVMNPDLNNINFILEYRLEPEIFSLYQLDLLLNNLDDNKCRIHLKLNTGMNRLGFNPEELDLIIKKIKDSPLVIGSVFTHLHSSEVANSDIKSHKQFKLFLDLARQLEAILGYDIIKHCSNTSAISRFPRMHLDMVRLGLGIYGITGDDKFEERLLPAHSWHSYISQIRTIKKGDGIGYNLSFIASDTMRIAVVNVGYADGLPRRLSNQGFNMFIEHQAVEVLGNISMDTCIINISKIPSAYIGMQVDIINATDQTLSAISLKAEMIPYELLCLVGPRVHKVYIQE